LNRKPPSDNVPEPSFADAAEPLVTAPVSANPSTFPENDGCPDRGTTTWMVAVAGPVPSVVEAE
jgi:hypothetical protein